MVRPFVGLIVLVVCGCGAPEARSGAARESMEAPPAASEPAASERQEAPLWSRAGLEAQPRMEWLRERVPAELGYSPATTPWRPVRRGAAGGLARLESARAASSGRLLARAAGALDEDGPLGAEVWERTTRVWDDGGDVAVGIILEWGLRDDAIAGRDYRVHMRRDASAWTLERVEERFHCGRGVTEDGLCI